MISKYSSHIVGDDVYNIVVIDTLDFVKSAAEDEIEGRGCFIS